MVMRWAKDSAHRNALVRASERDESAALATPKNVNARTEGAKQGELKIPAVLTDNQTRVIGGLILRFVTGGASGKAMLRSRCRKVKSLR